MSLDKWIKDPKKTKKKSTPKREIMEELIDDIDYQPTELDTNKSLHLLTKFVLTCSDSKCKYKKTLRKKSLKDKDKICPRCKKEMKVKVINI